MFTRVDFSGVAATGALRGPVPLCTHIAHLLTQRLGVEWRVGERLPSEKTPKAAGRPAPHGSARSPKSRARR